jgi:cellulose synthase/poly-beta-1,6-N-acetylglucosamine synthase-like glycosyltransferase
MNFEENRLESAVPGQAHARTNEEVKALSVGVVICTRNRPGLLQSCLEGVESLRPLPDEVIVVDNSPGDEETKRLALEHSARYIVEPIQGLSRARNRGMAESRSDIIAYLDDDAVPDQRWLAYLMEPFADPRIAAVTGGIVPAGASRTSPETDRVRSLTNEDPKWFEIAGFGGMGIGANMALRKSACLESTIFDLRLGRGVPIGGGEESLAFVRLLARGYRAIYVPEGVVSHDRKPKDVGQEASRAIAYWLLLFFEFPRHRFELAKFLWGRLRHKPLTWYRSSPELGPIITSGWFVRIRAALAGIPLYLRARKSLGK